MHSLKDVSGDARCDSCWGGGLRTALGELDLLPQQRVVGVLDQAARERPPLPALHQQQLRALRTASSALVSGEDSGQIQLQLQLPRCQTACMHRLISSAMGDADLRARSCAPGPKIRGKVRLTYAALLHRVSAPLLTRPSGWAGPPSSGGGNN